MSRTLFLIDSLAPSFAARQLSLLVRQLSGARVVVLGDETPSCTTLRGAGVRVETLRWRRPFDVRPLVALRRLLSQGDAVHPWGVSALWAAVLAGARPGQFTASHVAGRPSWATRTLLRRCSRIVAWGEAEADVYRSLGIPSDRLRLVPPAVAVTEPATPATWPGLPEDARVILCLGPIVRHKGFREAVWTLDILRCLFEDLHLVLVGAGADETRVRAFSRAVRLSEYVHFTGTVADVGPWLARAAVVWVPSLREGGRGAVLDALAAGRPLVVSQLPSLAELVLADQTALLVPAGDKTELARQTRRLLEDADRAAHLGETARRHAAERFSVTATAQAYC